MKNENKNIYVVIVFFAEKKSDSKEILEDLTVLK